jgi:hypothetical protein
MVYITLIIYSWSLIQFTLNLVVTRSKIVNFDDDIVSFEENNGSFELKLPADKQLSRDERLKIHQEEVARMQNKKMIHDEIWNVVTTLIMQDFPFFCLRSICVLYFNVVSYLFLFFTFKNGILFSLQVYRIISILTDDDYSFNTSNNKNRIQLLKNLLKIKSLQKYRKKKNEKIII